MSGWVFVQGMVDARITISNGTIVVTGGIKLPKLSSGLLQEKQYS